MFIGEYSHTIDEKSRLAIPIKFRAELASGAIVTKGLDGCLFLYTSTEWHKLVEKLNNMPISQKNARAFSRVMLAGAMDVSLDNQGRINLPEYLRNFASLSKKTVIAGLFDRLEIWDEDAWTKYKQNTEKDLGNIAEALGERGI